MATYYSDEMIPRLERDGDERWLLTFREFDDDDNDPMFSIYLDVDGLDYLNTVTREALNKWREDES
jgi:hypothetical protein